MTDAINDTAEEATMTNAADQGALAPMDTQVTATVTPMPNAMREVQPAEGVSPLVMMLARGELQAEHVQQAMALQEQHDAYNAKRAFSAAMAAFKGIVGKARRSGSNSHLRSLYSTYDDVVAAVSGPLAEIGISHRFRTTQDGLVSVTVTCILTHANGHSEEETRTYPVEEVKGLSKVQQIGVAEGYAKRRTLLAITGIASGEDDGDGNARHEARRQAATPEPVNEPPMTAEQESAIVDLLASIDELSEGFSRRYTAPLADRYQTTDGPLGFALTEPQASGMQKQLTTRLAKARSEQEGSV